MICLFRSSQILLLYGLCFFFFSCSVKPCDYNCSEGSLTIKMIFLDKETNENLFSNGTYKMNQLTLTFEDEQGEDEVPLEWIVDDHQLFLMAKNFEGVHGKLYFQLNDAPFLSADLIIDEVEEECCNNYELIEFKIKEADSEWSENGFYKILIRM